MWHSSSICRKNRTVDPKIVRKTARLNENDPVGSKTSLACPSLVSDMNARAYDSNRRENGGMAGMNKYSSQRGIYASLAFQMAHFHVKSLKRLAQDKDVFGLENCTFANKMSCDACNKAKSIRASFKASDGLITTQPLDLLHLDKSEVFSIYQDFVTHVERISGRKVKAIRTDREGEFVSNEFIKYLNDAGIEGQQTNPHSPQMNGVAERINRTMFDFVRAMLAETGLPHCLWAELSLTFAYLKNRSPHLSLDFKVPYVKWKQQRLSLRHLKQPGAKCFVHHTAPGQGKLEDRPWVGVLVDYAIGTRGYRVWDPATDRVVQTNHVKIDETVIYKHFRRQQEVESLQTADSSSVTECNWPKSLTDSSDDSSSTDSDDDSPAPIITTPERNLLLAPIPNATDIKASQSSTSQSGGRLTDALLYLTTSKPILKQSVSRRELDLPQPDNAEPADHLSEDNEDFEDAESLPNNELKRRVNFLWRLIGGYSIYSHWRREEHLRQDGSGRINVYYYPAPKIRLRMLMRIVHKLAYRMIIDVLILRQLRTMLILRINLNRIMYLKFILRGWNHDLTLKQ
uniref:Integrase catalytic domain-containing protein n=1 Tax=Strigamia maritima TaxID=126957 RepID=T1JHJ9_STRMM